MSGGSHIYQTYHCTVSGSVPVGNASTAPLTFQQAASQPWGASIQPWLSALGNQRWLGDLFEMPRAQAKIVEMKPRDEKIPEPVLPWRYVHHYEVEIDKRHREGYDGPMKPEVLKWLRDNCASRVQAIPRFRHRRRSVVKFVDPNEAFLFMTRWH